MQNSGDGSSVALVSWLLDLVAACFATGSSCAAVSSPDEGGRGAQANSRRRTAAAAPFFFLGKSCNWPRARVRATHLGSLSNVGFGLRLNAGLSSCHGKHTFGWVEGVGKRADGDQASPAHSGCGRQNYARAD